MEQVLRPTASRMDREVSGVEVNKSLPEPENKNGPGQHNKHLVLNYKVTQDLLLHPK